jgi:hypothetical protein
MGLSNVASAGIGDPSAASTNYKVVESEIGGNGQFNSSSTNYSVNPNIDDGGSSLGESAVGNSASSSYQTNSGFNTTAQPGLTLNVGGTPANLGTLSIGSANMATATFNVKNYTSWGYAVTIIGTAPSYRGHALAGMGTQSANSTGCSPSCASVNGTEQFGINLRANASPSAVGVDPAPIPSSAFSLSNPTVVLPLPYRTADAYRYFSGDTIAQAPSSSGETDYTISFMANMSNTTPGGRYTGNLQIVATGTF